MQINVQKGVNKCELSPQQELDELDEFIFKSDAEVQI